MGKHKKLIQNSKVKVSAPRWNDEFELPDGSYLSQIFDYIIKNHETFAVTTNKNIY